MVSERSLLPVGIKEDVDECGGDGRQRVWVQRHDAELVLGDQHRVNCGVEGWKSADGIHLRSDTEVPYMLVWEHFS